MSFRAVGDFPARGLIVDEYEVWSFVRAGEMGRSYDLLARKANVFIVDRGVPVLRSLWTVELWLCLSLLFPVSLVSPRTGKLGLWISLSRIIPRYVWDVFLDKDAEMPSEDVGSVLCFC